MLRGIRKQEEPIVQEIIDYIYEQADINDDDEVEDMQSLIPIIIKLRRLREQQFDPEQGFPEEENPMFCFRINRTVCDNCKTQTTIELRDDLSSDDYIGYCKYCGQVTDSLGNILIPGTTISEEESPMLTVMDIHPSDLSHEQLCSRVMLYMEAQLDTLSTVADLTSKVLAGTADDNDWTVLCDIIGQFD